MKKSLTLVLALGLSLVVNACSELPINEAIPFPVSFPQSDDFESGLSADWHFEANDNTSVTRSAPPGTMTGTGSFALRCVVKPSDVANHGNRAEVARYQVAQYGDDVYYGWDAFVPASDPDDYKWQILTQFYQLPDFKRGETFDFWGAHPPITLVREPGKLVLMFNAPTETRIAETTFAKDTKYRILLHVRWSNGPDGLVEWWMDGAPISAGGSSVFRGSTLHNRAGAYWKLGLYRGAVGQTQAPSTNEVWFDNIKIARSKAGAQ